MNQDPNYFLQGGGKMGELIRSFDWSMTSLGNINDWPTSLKITINIILSSPFPMYIAWGKEFIQLYNDGYRPILGEFKHPRALGSSTQETFQEIWPTIGSMFEGVMQGKAVGFSDFHLKLERNGFLEDCYFNFSYSPIRNENSSIGGVLVTVIETTENIKIQTKLKESEEKFRLLADNMSQLAWMADPTGYIFWYNQRWYDYTGTNFEEMKGWGWEKVQHVDHLGRVKNKFIEALQDKEIWEDIFPLKSKTGEFRWFLSRATPLLNEEGKVVRWLGTNTDITDQRKLDQQKEDFITVASHELKTPLTSLQLSIELLEEIKENPDSELFNNLIEISGRSIRKVNSLVDQLLNLSRLSNGHLEIQKSNFNLYTLVKKCFDEFKPSINYQMIFEGNKNMEIFADENRINQVITNLMTNAFKYANQSTKLLLKLEELENETKLSVIDFGSGISPENLSRLFDRYYRANKSSVVSGLGLGLYICQEIIKLHGGEIGVQSELGKGTSFWFTIPKS